MLIPNQGMPVLETPGSTAQLLKEEGDLILHSPFSPAESPRHNETKVLPAQLVSNVQDVFLTLIQSTAWLV